MRPPEEDRSAIAVALGWAMQIIAISALMALPAFVGYWIDLRLGTRVVFTLIGSGLGIALGAWQLAQLVRVLNRKNSSNGDDAA